MIDANISPIDVNSKGSIRENLKLRLLCLLEMQSKLTGQYIVS